MHISIYVVHAKSTRQCGSTNGITHYSIVIVDDVVSKLLFSDINNYYGIASMTMTRRNDMTLTVTEG